MVLYGGIEYGNTPGGGTPSGGTPGGGVPSGGSGPVGPLVGGLGNLGNLLLGYLGGGGLGPGSQAGQTPTGGQPGTPPPTQHPNPTPGGVPVVVVGDPGSGGGNGSGNNSGNSYQSNEVNIPGFGNVSFNAPSLPPITPAQFGNSPPLSLIAQLTNPNFQAGGGGAPTYDTNVGNSGSVQGAPGQMMEQRRDSPSGPAAPQMPGPAGGELRQNPNGVVLGSRGPAQMDTPPTAPPRPQLIASNVGGPPGMPPMPGGMPPTAPPVSGGAGATESQAQFMKRLKDKLRGAYQRGEITPEEMNQLSGMAEGGSAAPQVQPTNQAPPDEAPLAPISEAPAAPVDQPKTPAQIAREQRQQEIQYLAAKLEAQGNPADYAARRVTQLEQAYANRANHPTGSNSPLINGVVSRWNRWKYGAQADPRNASYQAREQVQKELAGQSFQFRVKDYNETQQRLQHLFDEVDADSIAQEKESKAAEKDARDFREKQLDDSRRDVEKRLATIPPGPKQEALIKHAVARGLYTQDEADEVAALYGDVYDEGEAADKTLAREAKALENKYNKEVKNPAGKLRYESAKRLAPTKEQLAQEELAGKRLANFKRQHDNGQLTAKDAMQARKDEAYLQGAEQRRRMNDYVMAGGAIDDADKALTLDVRRTGGGMFDPAKFAAKGIQDPAQKKEVEAKYNQNIQQQLQQRSQALETRTAARERAMSASVAQAVQQGDPNKAYYEQVKTSMADGSHTRAELEAGLSKRGLSIKALEAKYGPIGKPGAK